MLFIVYSNYIYAPQERISASSTLITTITRPEPMQP